jgi:hypothetical protein
MSCLSCKFIWNAWECGGAMYANLIYNIKMDLIATDGPWLKIVWLLIFQLYSDAVEKVMHMQ